MKKAATNRNYTTTPNQMSIDLEDKQTDGKREGESTIAKI